MGTIRSDLVNFSLTSCSCPLDSSFPGLLYCFVNMRVKHFMNLFDFISILIRFEHSLREKREKLDKGERL